MIRRRGLVVLAAATLALGACAQQGERQAPAAGQAAEGETAPPSDAPATTEEIVAIPAAEADPATLEPLRAEYPLTTCPVSGVELGSVGEPYEVLYGGRLVRFCTPHCLMKFELDPATYLAKIDSAAAARSES